jgi:hypothetical protein
MKTKILIFVHPGGKKHKKGRKIMRIGKISMLSIMMLLSILLVCIADNHSYPNEDVYMNPESLVRGLYASVTFEPGTLPDWDYVRSFFITEAVFGVRKSRTLMDVLDLDGFVDWWLDDIEKHSLQEKGLEESMEKMKMTVYGHIAQCFVVYKVRLLTPAGAPGQLGLDSFALMKKDGRWWIVSITNDVIDPQNPLPEILRQ